jgi:hypothetical protein
VQVERFFFFFLFLFYFSFIFWNKLFKDDFLMSQRTTRQSATAATAEEPNENNADLPLSELQKKLEAHEKKFDDFSAAQSETQRMLQEVSRQMAALTARVSPAPLAASAAASSSQVAAAAPAARSADGVAALAQRGANQNNSTSAPIAAPAAAPGDPLPLGQSHQRVPRAVPSADEVKRARERALKQFSAVSSRELCYIQVLHSLLYENVWKATHSFTRAQQMDHLYDVYDELRSKHTAFALTNSVQEILHSLANAGAAPLTFEDMLPFFDAVSLQLVAVPFQNPSLSAVQASDARIVREAALSLMRTHGDAGTHILCRPAIGAVFVVALMKAEVIQPRVVGHLLTSEAMARDLEAIGREMQAAALPRAKAAYVAKQKSSAGSGGGRNRNKRNKAPTVAVNAVETQDDDNKHLLDSFSTVSDFKDHVFHPSVSDFNGHLPNSFSRPKLQPPLAVVNGVVEGALTRTLIDMGSQVHIASRRFARLISDELAPVKPLAANGTPIKVLGSIGELQWTSQSTRHAKGKPTRLHLIPVLVADGALPANVDLLIGAGALYGLNPRRVTYANADSLGFFVAFDDCAPLACVPRSKDTMSVIASAAAVTRCLEAPDSSIRVVDASAPRRYPSLPRRPAVTRAEQPPVQYDATGVRVADDVYPFLKDAISGAAAPFVSDDTTPPVIPGFVCELLLKGDADFNAFQQPVPRQSQREEAAMVAEAKRLLAAGAARHAKSSPVRSVAHAVPKKDEHGKPTGEYRIVGAYHYVNQGIIPDSYPLPRIDHLVKRMAKAKRFSKIDLTKAFEQGAFTEASVPLTATYYAPGYILERLSCAFGIANVPAALQRFLDNLFKDFDTIIIFVDDLIILHMSDDPQAVADDVRRVLERLVQAGVSVKASKCAIGFPELLALGFHVAHGSYTPDEHRVAAWANLPRPATVKGLRSFLHTLSHYSAHFAALAKHAAPLRALEATKKTHLQWSPSQEQAFLACKAYVLDHCVLGGRAALAPLPPPGTSVTLHTDWARISQGDVGGVGWVIHANIDGKPMILSCGSRALPKSDLYNRSHRGELYALQCALKRDAHILRDFDVTWVTDCQPAALAWGTESVENDIIHVLTRDLRAAWPHLKAKWVPRAQNPIADMFSAAVHRCDDERSVREATVSAITSIMGHDSRHNRYLVKTDNTPHAQWKTASVVRKKAPDLVQEWFNAKKRTATTITRPLPIPENAAEIAGPVLTRGRKRLEPRPTEADAEREHNAALTEITLAAQRSPLPAPDAPIPDDVAQYVRDMRQAQRDDVSLAHLWRAALAKDDDELDAAERTLVHTLAPQVVANGLLCVAPLTSVDPPRIVVPTCARPPILIASHEEGGHFAGKASLANIERHFWWPRISVHVTEVAKACKLCQEARQHRRKADLGAPRLAGVAMQEVLVDMQVNVAGVDLLTILDVATRWQWIVPIAKGVANKSKTLAREFLRATRAFGVPQRIVADGGREFQGDFVAVLQAATGATFDVNAPYNPNARGAVERVHRTNASIVAKLRESGSKATGAAFFSDVQRIYNETPRTDCAVAPFEAMFGRGVPATRAARYLIGNDAIAAAMTALYAACNVATTSAAAVATIQAAVVTQNYYRFLQSKKNKPLAPIFQVGDKVLYESTQAQTKLDNRVSRTGPFVVSDVRDDGHTLELSYDNIVVEKKVASRNCVPWLDVRDCSFMREAPEADEWLVAPHSMIDAAWCDDDALAFHPRHRRAWERSKVGEASEPNGTATQEE